MDESDDEDHLDDFQFPDVTNFGDVQHESVCKPLDTYRFLHEADDYSSETSFREKLKRTSNWLKLRANSPVLDAWMRWYNRSEFKEDELCSFLNVSPSSRPVQLVLSYMLGETVHISIEELKDVLEISNMLLLEDLVNYCKYRIQKIELNEDNFLQILELNSLYDFVNPGMKRFVTSHLTLLHEMDGSESLTFDTVIFLLTNDLLTYWSTEERFHFITKWCRASTPRRMLFSSLFNQLDISCLDSDFIESIIGKDSLVQSSEFCLRQVEDALKRGRKSKTVAALLIRDADRSEFFVYILEDRRSGYLTIPRFIEDTSFSLWTTILPDSIVFITNSNQTKRRDVVKYDINTGKFKVKKLVLSTPCKDELSDLVWQNNVAFLIGHDTQRRKKKKTSVGFRTKSKNRIVASTEHVPFSTVYMKTKENSNRTFFLPLMSFCFEIIQTCIFKSRLFLRSRSDESFFHFNWNNSTLTKTTIPRDMCAPSALVSLLPLNDTVFAVFQSYVIQLVLDENTELIKSTRKFYVDVGSDPFFTLAIKDTLVRVDNEYVHVCDTIQNPTSWKSFEFNYWMLTSQSNVCHGLLRGNVRICHQDCPHCFPYADKLEDEYTDFAVLYEEKLKLKALKRSREAHYYMPSSDDDYLDNDFYVDHNDYSFDDDFYMYGFNDDDDDYWRVYRLDRYYYDYY